VVAQSDIDVAPPRRRALSGVVVVVVVLWALHVASDFFVPVMLAALLAFLMAPGIRLMRKLHFPGWLASMVAALIVLLPLVGLIYLIVQEVQELIRNWPQLTASFQHAFAQLRDSSIADRLHLRAILDLSSLEERLHANLGSELVVALTSVKAIFTAGSIILLTIFFGITMLASRAHLERAAHRLFASYTTIASRETVGKIARMIEAFLVARTLIAVGLGAVSFVILLVCGVPYAFLLGAFLGAMTWVPVVGLLAGMIPVVLVGLAAGTSATAIVIGLALIVVVWAVQDHIVTPKIVGHRLQLSFLASYLAFFAGGLLWGAWGMILSIPLLGVIRIVCAASPKWRPLAFAIGADAGAESS
jgi:predicted PurR-regulated permease PerM